MGKILEERGVCMQMVREASETGLSWVHIGREGDKLTRNASTRACSRDIGPIRSNKAGQDLN
jgi:hypothetical protein